jgi:hypothetical protein
MASSNLNDILAEAMGKQGPTSKMTGLPVEVIASKPAYHIKAQRLVGRLLRLMQARPTTEVEASILAHQVALTELGFRAPKTLKECRELATKLEA